MLSGSAYIGRYNTHCWKHTVCEATHSSRHQMPFLSPYQLLCGLLVPRPCTQTQFHCTRSVSQNLCACSLALNTIKSEVSLVFVKPPQQLPPPLTHARVSVERAIITGLRTVLSELISMLELRNAEYDTVCGLYWCYIKLKVIMWS